MMCSEPEVLKEIMAEKSQFEIEQSGDVLETEVIDVQISNEALFRVLSDPVRHHCELKPFMRSMLVDWLKEVADSFRLKRETLYLAVAYLER
jgi:hypothetical protein